MSGQGLEFFSREIFKLPLRSYQLEVGRAIVESVERGRGDVITVMMARQMGKNELSAQVEAYLLARYHARGGTMIKAAPTFKPQLLNSRQRLERLLNSPLTRGRWQSRQGYIISLGRAELHFLSGAPGASVVGATASLLLEMDEAQDLSEEKYQKDFRPMGSSTNTTTVLYGTAWTADTLLSREIKRTLQSESQAGRRLHFAYPWTVLAAQNPAYAAFVQGEIARLGAEHPLIKTQYALEELDRAGKLFSADDLARLQGGHAPLYAPVEGEVYVAGVDVGGETAGEEPTERGEHDATVVTIGRVVPSDVHLPALEVVAHECWEGMAYQMQHERLLDLAGRVWRCKRLVIDGSGLGAGLASWLKASLPGVVEIFTFSRKSKSDLGWSLLSAVSAGRFTIYGNDGSSDSRRCWQEFRDCVRELLSNETLNFFVPPAKGHDDFVVSAALCAWAARDMAPAPASEVVHPRRLYLDGRY